MNKLSRRNTKRRGIIFASIMLCIFFCKTTYSQIMHHQMIASIVSSKVTTNGLSVHQSIGQLSMNGNYVSSSLIVQQGFQQSRKFIKARPTPIRNLITTTVFPNPVRDYVNFQFSEPVQGNITIVLFDMSGRLILKQNRKETIDTLVTLESLSSLPEGQYIVQLKSSNYKFSTKLIKMK